MNILFVNAGSGLGGVTSSLKNLTTELLRHGHQVAVLNIDGSGFLKEQLSPGVEFIEMEGKARKWSINSTDFHRAKGLKKLPLLAFGVRKKLLGALGVWESCVFSSVPVIECDAAVAFRQGNTLTYLVTRKTTAKRKVAFIHSELDQNIPGWVKYYDDVDGIACVSNDWRDRFKESFPQWKDKAHTVYNLFDAEKIKQLASRENSRYPQDVYNIVTVSRIDTPQKNIDWVPTVSEILKKKGLKFHWTIVGDGPSRRLVEENIRKTKTQDVITLTGAQSNPYPYIKNAELFVLLSNWESYGMVLVEALILGTPVVTTGYPAAYEIIEDGKTGLMTALNEGAVADGIYRMLTDRELYRKIKENCENYRYDISVGYRQFEEICGIEAQEEKR